MILNFHALLKRSTKSAPWTVNPYRPSGPLVQTSATRHFFGVSTQLYRSETRTAKSVSRRFEIRVQMHLLLILPSVSHHHHLISAERIVLKQFSDRLIIRSQPDPDKCPVAGGKVAAFEDTSLANSMSSHRYEVPERARIISRTFSSRMHSSL